MRFTETKLQGAFIIDIEPIEDERGFFARSFCRKEFIEHGLKPDLAQCNISFNKKQGTLRGMHYQKAPHAEAKVVRCTRGAIYDVIVDLRPDSPGFKQWVGVELSADNHRMLYVPEGFAHGFQTLQDNSEVLYQMSCDYVPDCAAGVRWNDPLLNIHWPGAPLVISRRDSELPGIEE